MSIQELHSKFQEIQSSVDLSALEQERLEVQKQLKDPNSWEDQDRLKELNQELKSLERKLASFAEIQDSLDFLQEFNQEMKPENLENEIQNLQHKISQLEVQTLLNHKYDKLSAIVSIYSGAGGDDAEDFTRMIFDMYQKYAENHEYDHQLIECSYTESGIKHVSFKVSGPYAYGYLKAEHGVHRLVRLSPFNSGNTRETSFCLVDVIPVIRSNTELNLDPADLRIDTFKSQGPGGQSVNTTDSAVRITHLPSKISASCQSERSQHQNKENAMDILKAKLTHLMEEQEKQNLSDIRGESKQISFGSQIRSYTLHPYKLVKDHRTNQENSNPDAVFDGDLDPFIYSYLSSTQD